MFAMGPAFFGHAAASYATLTLTGTFAAATVGVAYSSSIPISGGLEPYSLTGGTGVVSGSLDSGFSLSITGTTGARFLTLSCASPTTADTMAFTASVDSSDGQTATSMQSVVVASGHAWLAQWGLSELAGTIAEDSSGNAYDATYSGTGYVLGSMSLLPSGTGHSVYLPGTAYIALPAAGVTARTIPFSIVAYCQVQSFGNSPQIYAETNGGIALVFDAGGHLELANPGIATLATDTVALSTATKYQVGVTFDGNSTVNFYVDGAFTSTHELSKTPANGVSPGYLGAFQASLNPLNGYLQRVRVVNAVLSATDFAQLYATD